MDHCPDTDFTVLSGNGIVHAVEPGKATRHSSAELL